MITNHKPNNEGYLSGEELLKAVWPNAKSRPSLRWLREQQAVGKLPYIKVGHFVFFNPDKVRAWLESLQN